MAMTLNLKSTANAIDGILVKLADKLTEGLTQSDLGGAGLEGFERELRGALAEAERGVMAEKLAQ